MLGKKDRSPRTMQPPADTTSRHGRGAPTDGGAATIAAIVNLLLASPREALERGAGALDAAIALVCARLDARERQQTLERLGPLEALFPLSSAQLAAPVETRPAGLAEELDAARTAPMHDLLEMAGRPDVDARLSAILVFRGNSDVLATLTGNPGARFATSSLNTLIELAPADRRIKDNLCARTDLPEPLALRLLPFLNRAQLVRLLTAGCAIDAATAASDLATERDVFNGSGVDPSRPLDATIAMLCQDARISEISEVVAERLGLPMASAMNVLCARLDHMACLGLNAAGASAAVIPGILALRQRLECRSGKDRRGAYEAFARYDQTEARSIIEACAAALSERGLVFSDLDFLTNDPEA